MTPIHIIKNLMQNKKIDSEINSELLIHFYEKSTISEKERINKIIVCICGYSLETIIHQPNIIKKT